MNSKPLRKVSGHKWQKVRKRIIETYLTDRKAGGTIVEIPIEFRDRDFRPLKGYGCGDEGAGPRSAYYLIIDQSSRQPIVKLPREVARSLRDALDVWLGARLTIGEGGGAAEGEG